MADLIPKKILIAGDSFASQSLSQGQGWPDILGARYQIINTARPGIGEYKILQSIRSSSLEDFDHVIISHTSPFRLHCETNPLYAPGHVYRDSDIIFADAESKSNTSTVASMLVHYFRAVYDPAYQIYAHGHCCRDIAELTASTSVSHLTFFDWSGLHQFSNMLMLHQIWRNHPGDICHLDETGNHKVATLLFDVIDNIDT